MTKEKKYSKRKQQVKRQLLLIAAVTVLVAGSLGIYILPSSSESRETAGAVAETADKEGALQKAEQEIREETPQERLARVKETAIERGYPQGVIELLDKNAETVEFVENYNEKKNSVPAKTIGTDLKAGQIPELIQWDERWGYGEYAGELMGISGCGPTCLSMVCIQLLQDASYTPQYVAAFAEENGYAVKGNGSAWALISEGGEKLGLDVTEIPLDEGRIIRNLEVGNPIICVMGPGDFTTSGHFIVLTQYADGYVKVNDPNSPIRSQKLWKLTDIMPQMNNLWVCR